MNPQDEGSSNEDGDGSNFTVPRSSSKDHGRIPSHPRRDRKHCSRNVIRNLVEALRSRMESHTSPDHRGRYRISLATAKKIIKAAFPTKISKLGDKQFATHQKTGNRLVAVQNVPERYHVQFMSILFAGSVTCVYQEVVGALGPRKGAPTLWDEIESKVFND